MTNNKFIFDVDGTLTPSRQRIDSTFAAWFLEFCKLNDVYLVTGSDIPKTIEQIGQDICNTVKRIYSCSGNEVWQDNYMISYNNWEPSEELLNFLESLLLTSDFGVRTGNHIEKRRGCINFSIVGRNASVENRILYKLWDESTNEREKLAQTINYSFQDINAVIGGETGLDIFPTGYDKSQILKDFSSIDNIYFFGDKTDPGGNDYPLAKNLKHVYKVTDWSSTYQILMYFQKCEIAA